MFTHAKIENISRDKNLSLVGPNFDSLKPSRIILSFPLIDIWFPEMLAA